MDEDLIFDNAFYKLAQWNMSFDRRAAVFRFSVYASEAAAEKGARQIMEPVSVRIDGELFDTLTDHIAGCSDVVKDILEKAIVKQNDLDGEKEKITWED